MTGPHEHPTEEWAGRFGVWGRRGNGGEGTVRARAAGCPNDDCPATVEPHRAESYPAAGVRKEGRGAGGRHSMSGIRARPFMNP